MKDRIEQLFSPERLRDSWEQAEEPPALPEQLLIPAPQPEHPKELLLKLRGLINERYPEGRGEAVRAMMTELERIFAERFTEDKDVPVNDKAALDADIEQILTSMEGLVDALNVGLKKQ